MLEHRFAIGTALATFLLLMVGGTVNPTGSSLACPEAWFICKGTMLPEMTGGVLFEHGHRMVAMTVGLLQIGLTVLLWRRRKELRWLAVGALVLVCIQGSLGATTVAFKLPTAVSTAHLMTAMLYFALLIYLCWRTRPVAETAPSPVSARLHTWITVAAVAVYAQISLGALVRHSGGALASIYLPLHQGQFWPDGGFPLKVHMLHRIVGVLVGVLVLGVGVAAYRGLKQHGKLRGLAALAPMLVIGQVTLGVLAIWTIRSTPVVVAHVGVAAALWATFVLLWLGTRASRVQAPQRSANAVMAEAVS